LVNISFICDVGGQKPERRKWDVIATTHKPTALLFFTSLVDFDIPLITEEGKTRMDESLEVWGEILNKEEFENATIILFLNKYDLFEDKIERVKLSDTFQDYKGTDLQAATDFIKGIFQNKVQNTKHTPESIHVHTTCAIDTSVMQVVFESVTEEIFKQRLALAGLDI
jgi:GTPase SAR1 family protein